MYVAVVVLTMLVLPVGSIIAEHLMSPAAPIIGLIGRWFVFWGVGVRLGLAGIRQILQPAFTARTIFHMTTDEALPLVRELGVANAGTALIALLSLMAPAFVLPAAISAGLFFAVAGFAHVAERDRSGNENIAMVSDLFIALVLAGFIVVTVLAR